MTSLVKHLHAFIKDVEPTNEEWMAGIQFLTDTGHMCTDWRQEFILLSDTLGVSMLVETINNRKPSRRHRDHRARPVPRRRTRRSCAHGANICLDGKGEPLLVTRPGHRPRRQADRRARRSTSGRPTRTASTTSSRRASSPT